MRKLSCALLTAAALTFTSPAAAALHTWTFTGEIDSPGVFSTYGIGDPFTLTVVFDPDQTGTDVGPGVEYWGAAFFASTAGASDSSARIFIGQTSSRVFVTLEEPDAVLPSLEYTNLPGQFGDVDWIELRIVFGGAASGELTDFLDFALPGDELDRRVVFAVPASASPTGVVTGFSSSGSEAVPLAHPYALTVLGAALAWTGARRIRR